MGNRFTSCTICLDISISDGTGTLGCSSGYPNAFTVVIVRMVNPGFNEWRMKRRYGAAGSRSIDTIFDISVSSQLWNQSIVMLNVSLYCSNRRRTCVQCVGSFALCVSNERASKKELRHRDVLIQTLLIKDTFYWLGKANLAITLAIVEYSF